MIGPRTSSLRAYVSGVIQIFPCYNCNINLKGIKGWENVLAASVDTCDHFDDYTLEGYAPDVARCSIEIEVTSAQMRSEVAAEMRYKKRLKWSWPCA